MKPPKKQKQQEQSKNSRGKKEKKGKGQHFDVKTMYVQSQEWQKLSTDNHCLQYQFKGQKMSLINVDLLKLLAQIYQDKAEIGEHFKKFQNKYKFNFNNDLPSNVIEKVDKINNKFPCALQNTDQDQNQQKNQSFAFGQLKIFTWVLALYCYRQEIMIEEMKDSDLQEIRLIFQNKSLMFIRYESISLAYERSKYALEWTQQEIEKMVQIIKSKETLGEWRRISYQLYSLSEGEFYRPFQQCRQKWFNHLDPKVCKGKWTIEEDIALLSAVDCLECKWIQIYRELGGVRTEHMIKNRYKSLMKKWKKKYKKTQPQKNSSSCSEASQKQDQER